MTGPGTPGLCSGQQTWFCSRPSAALLQGRLALLLPGWLTACVQLAAAKGTGAALGTEGWAGATEGVMAGLGPAWR